MVSVALLPLPQPLEQGGFKGVSKGAGWIIGKHIPLTIEEAGYGTLLLAGSQWDAVENRLPEGVPVEHDPQHPEYPAPRFAPLADSTGIHKRPLVIDQGGAVH